MKGINPEAIWHFVHKHWLHGLVGIIFFTAIKVSAEYWIKQKTLEQIKKDEFIERVATELDRNLIGASYQAYFVIDPNSNQNEHFIPIYVSGESEVKLYLLAEHHGTGELRNVDIFIDDELVNFNLGKEKFIKKKIVLTEYLKESQKKGVHDFNENFHVLYFKSDATQKTDDIITVKALVNVLGLSRVMDFKESEE